MLTPSTATVADYTAAVKADAPYHVRITFLKQNIVLTDADIVAGGFVIQSIVNPDTDLRVGKSIMDEVNIQIINSSKLDDLSWGQEFTVEFGLEVGLITDWVTVGYFSGTRPDRVHNVDVVNFVAHDRMGMFDTLADDWLASLTYPMTVGQMYTSLCSYVGVTSVSGDELPNMLARTYVSAPIKATGVMCRDVLSAIAEACGCYAKINADGNVVLKWFSDQQTYTLGASDEFAVDSLDLKEGKKWSELESETWADLEQYRWVDLEGYQGALRINSVTVKLTEDDIGVSYPSQSGYNDYLIIDNPFLVTNGNAEVQAYLAPLFNRLNGFGGYLPITVTVVGNALVEAGDVITVDVNGKNYRLPIFTKLLQWTGGLTDQYQSTGDVKRQEITGEQRVKLSEGGRYHIWKNTVDQLYSELYDPTTGDVSVLKQTAQALGMSAQGIDIQGGKYVRIESGGVLDVDSQNFKINSTDGYVQSGQFKYNDSGVQIDKVLPIENYGNINTRFILSDEDNAVIPNDKYVSGIVYHHDGFYNSFTDKITYDPAIAIVRYESGTLKSKIYLGNSTQGEIIYDSINDLSIGTAEHSIYHLYTRSVIPGDVQGQARTVIGTSLKPFHEGYFKTVYYNYLVQNSSKGIKHDIQPLPSVGEKLDELKPVTFVYDDDKNEKVRSGLIYEDTVEVLPEICTDDESNKAINYVELIPMLLKEIQDLRARVKALEEREVE